MCRLFGTISASAVDSPYLLERASRSLLYQSRVSRKELQKDGWGIGWFEKRKPAIIKSPRAIYQDRKRLAHAVRKAKGHSLIGHVRWASNPMKLPKHLLIGLAHTQPFQHKQWIFAHNGTLLIPKEVRKALGPLEKYVTGNNDSEVLFYWLLKHLRRREAKPIVSSIRRALSHLDSIWSKCRKKYPLYKHPMHGLNWVLMDGKMLIAMCYVKPSGFGKAKALTQRHKPYYQLHYKRDSQGWTVASEPLDDDSGWKTFRHGQILIAGRQGGRFYSL